MVSELADHKRCKLFYDVQFDRVDDISLYNLRVVKATVTSKPIFYGWWSPTWKSPWLGLSIELDRDETVTGTIKYIRPLPGKATALITCRLV